MTADRTETLTVTRSHQSCVAKATIKEDGVLVSYSVKTYESRIKEGVQAARDGAEKLLKETK